MNLIVKISILKYSRSLRFFLFNTVINHKIYIVCFSKKSTMSQDKEEIETDSEENSEDKSDLEIAIEQNHSDIIQGGETFDGKYALAEDGSLYIYDSDDANLFTIQLEDIRGLSKETVPFSLQNLLPRFNCATITIQIDESFEKSLEMKDVEEADRLKQKIESIREDIAQD